MVTCGVLLLLAGCGASPDAAAPTADPAVERRPEDPAGVASGADGVLSSPSEHHPTRVAEPVAVEIPTISVTADLVDLGLNDDRTLEVPSAFDVAGWYTGRPPPGAIGPAIIVGHVDSRDGPAVFHRLRELAPGDRVLVHRADASTARFTVDRVEQHPKDDFPTQAVYGPTDDSTLRLITCGGPFDRNRSSYDDNIVVFATVAPP